MKNTQTIISVIIPTYMPQDYLWECLEALYKQSLAKEYYEVILVLDGEKEPYYQSIVEFVNSNAVDLKCSIIYTELMGVSNARNIGIDSSAGSYCCFVDDDDLVSPNYLANLLAKADEQSLVVSDVRTFTNGLENLGYDYLSKAFRETREDNIFARRSFLSSSCGKLIHRKMIADRRFCLMLKNSEDSVFMYKISDRISRIVLADVDTIYYRRIRPSSASRRKQGLFEKLRNALLSTNANIFTYLQNPFKYNFTLLLSRIAATIVRTRWIN